MSKNSILFGLVGWFPTLIISSFAIMIFAVLPHDHKNINKKLDQIQIDIIESKKVTGR